MALPRLLQEALHTKSQFDIGLWRQFWQSMLLRFGRGRLDPWEYYFFRVFLDRYPPHEKRRFIGWRREIALDRLLNRGPAREIANDKLRFATFMQEQDMPLPRTVAVCGGPSPTGARALADRAAVSRYLKETDDYPVFVKPMRGAHGHAAILLREPPADADAFAARLMKGPQRGYLIQELLRTHPALGAVCGDRLTSVRIVVFPGEGGPNILSAVWRVPTGANVTDNFNVGFSGNLIAGVDLASGEIARVVQGIGWQTGRVDHHPDTGKSFTGLRLPDWQDLVALCERCMALFPELRLQHWDIALTDRGPVVLELNVEGGLRTHQIVAEGPANLSCLYDVGA